MASSVADLNIISRAAGVINYSRFRFAFNEARMEGYIQHWRTLVQYNASEIVYINTESVCLFVVVKK
jgi:hypothetical protein